jgi:hypothetical protein
MVRVFRPQPDARSIIEPEPASLGLLLRNLEPLPPPDPLDAFVVHHPPGVPQHGCDPSIAITAVLGGERDDVGGQSRLIIPHRWNLALGGSMLAKNPTRKALRHTMLGNNMIHTGTAAGGAYQFPEAASLRISFSIVRSETARRSCLFSDSSSLSRLT